jgi:hypothetical protein
VADDGRSDAALTGSDDSGEDVMIGELVTASGFGLERSRRSIGIGAAATGGFCAEPVRSGAVNDTSGRALDDVGWVAVDPALVRSRDICVIT